MTDREIARRTAALDRVWERVQKAKPLQGGAELKLKKLPQGPAAKYDPRKR